MYKETLIDTFVTAGIAYYLGGDWQNVFRISRNRSAGKLYRVCGYWCKKKDKDFEKALNIFFTVKD